MLHASISFLLFSFRLDFFRSSVGQAKAISAHKCSTILSAQEIYINRIDSNQEDLYKGITLYFFSSCFAFVRLVATFHSNLLLICFILTVTHVYGFNARPTFGRFMYLYFNPLNRRMNGENIMNMSNKSQLCVQFQCKMEQCNTLNFTSDP